MNGTALKSNTQAPVSEGLVYRDGRRDVSAFPHRRNPFRLSGVEGLRPPRVRRLSAQTLGRNLRVAAEVMDVDHGEHVKRVYVAVEPDWQIAQRASVDEFLAGAEHLVPPRLGTLTNPSSLLAAVVSSG